MTVNDLIQILKTMPQDLEVFDFSYERVVGCHINEELFDGDSANPNCPIIRAVMID